MSNAIFSRSLGAGEEDVDDEVLPDEPLLFSRNPHIVAIASFESSSDSTSSSE